MSKPLPTAVLVDDGDMYQSAAKVYPHEIDGRFQRLRKLAVFVLLGLFYLAPWIEWDGRQAVLFDLPARKFYILGLTFWPQDFVFLSLLLMLAAFSLFFFTALAGRLWCGYACPQTVWTEVFLWIEQRIEGSRNQRMKLDAAPWSARKLARKSGKQLIWIALALWTGFTFVGFFTPIRELGVRTIALDLGGWEAFWLLFYSAATYGNAGFLREQVCKYMCPYARFQGAMFDRDTLIISYDVGRGERRGARKKSADYKTMGLGDCIDCDLCVQVCPTGIDIRNGLQYECIACGACVDACDSVMDKMGYARGLVRYSTQNAIEHRRVRILRPRIMIYATILLAIATLFIVALISRNPLNVDVLRDRNALYRETADGGIENAYTLKLTNKDERAHVYSVRVETPIALESRLGTGAAGEFATEISVDAQALASVPIVLRAERGATRGRSEIVFVIASRSDPAVSYRQKSSFFAPP
jgi:cytochrome c oxidase accessory protein FixG